MRPSEMSDRREVHIVNHRAYREHRIPTSLQRHVGMSSLSDAELRAMAERAWRERGVVVLFPDQNLPPMSRALIESEARRLYGERGRG